MSIVGCTVILLSATSCREDLSNPETTGGKMAQLRIEPTINSVAATRAEKNTWAEGDSIGIFLTTQEGRIGNPYLQKDSYSNIAYTYASSLWTAERETNLGVDWAGVYAYYPYLREADPTAVPVSLEGQTDYLYGKADTLVNYLRKVATIRMKHAMTQFVLQLTLGEYDGEGVVSDITLRNTRDNRHIVDGGTLNIATGEIQGGSATSLALWKTDSVSIKGSKLSLSYIMVPTGETAAEGDIRLEITIDGKVFYYDFQAGTDWKAGYRNIYRSTLNSNALVIDPENGIIIEPWKDDSEHTQVELVPVS